MEFLNDILDHHQFDGNEERLCNIQAERNKKENVFYLRLIH